ncbi:MAG: TAXI family TRAP transporter solute-binding subunit [Rhizobiales bacterium]|nr:TAXI family TRAP transporter solute-binding subunit [Hyphomicrobiales bacterium]
MSLSKIKDLFLVAVPALLIIGGAFWATYQFVEPAPPKHISIATGSSTGAYYGFGQDYARILKRSGIELDVVSSAGSLDNLKRLHSKEKRTELALMQGGVASQGERDGLMSLGRIFLEPLWVFYRPELEINRLTDLKEKRIAIGPTNSGTRQLANALLSKNGITHENAEFLSLSGNEAISALEQGQADAVFLVVAPSSPFIQGLLKKTTIKLMSFERADAYSRIFPYLSKVTLPEGTIDFVANIPSKNISLIAPSAALIARDDLHPALAGLLIQALKEVHSKGDIFQKTAEFPKVTDPEFLVTSDTKRSYKDGVPFLQRYLPFWLASFLQRSFILLLPIATVLFPIIKLAPLLYNWRIRNRLLHWYQQLKKLEHNINEDVGYQHFAENMTELERIESTVQLIPVPKDFSDQFYHLRGAISLVRERLELQAEKVIS